MSTVFPDKNTTGHDSFKNYDRKKGRGSVTNETGRFEPYRRGAFSDGWQDQGNIGGGGQGEPLKTELFEETPRHIITKNKSPDIPFDKSINAYRGCEHGCVYCFARPTHSYMGLSAGLDFESKLFYKPTAAALLDKELSKKGYKVSPIAMGTNTDPYQPIEKKLGITRAILEVLSTHRHPVTIVTKSALVLRDMDILEDMARDKLVRVAVSVTTLDRKLARLMEPRASTPQRRLDAIRILSDAGIQTGVMMAPVIPALNDVELETVLTAAYRAGAREAAYILLRLPFEVKDIFSDWLEEHFPDRKKRVLNRLHAMRGGRANDPRFGYRMRGRGIEADLLHRRYRNMCQKLGYSGQGQKPGYTGLYDALACDRFVRTIGNSAQLSLF